MTQHHLYSFVISYASFPHKQRSNLFCIKRKAAPPCETKGLLDGQRQERSGGYVLLFLVYMPFISQSMMPRMVVIAINLVGRAVFSVKTKATRSMAITTILGIMLWLM